MSLLVCAQGVSGLLQSTNRSPFLFRFLSHRDYDQYFLALEAYELLPIVQFLSSAIQYDERAWWIFYSDHIDRFEVLYHDA